MANLVDRFGKPFNPDPAPVSFALMRNLLEAASKKSPLFPSVVSRLHDVVAEVTGEHPGKHLTIKWRRYV